jgi:hypothetical protein
MKYIEVMQFYFMQNPTMYCVLIMGFMVIALMIYAADRDNDSFTGDDYE